MMLQDTLNWRYATKKMNATRDVPQDKVDRIVEAVRMAPSSSGLQPYHVFQITNDALRAEIRAAAADQAQITEGSHLLVFAAWDNYTADRIDRFAATVGAARGGLTDQLTAYYEALKSSYLPREPQVNFEHAARQAYIGLGFALATAAEEEVDSTPMEGFDPAKVDTILGLTAKGLRSVVLLPLGYRDAPRDWLVSLPKVRAPRTAFVTELA
jgi:nitroreductase/dihydropteridine reductase